MGSQQNRMERAVDLARMGATVIVANTRAARSLRLETERRAFEKQPVCETPDILPLEAWVSRTWIEGLLAGAVDRALLRPGVAAALWEQIVSNSSVGKRLMSPEAAARLAVAAWKLIHDYKLPLSRSAYSITDETKAFFSWAESFETRCRREGWVDSATALGEMAQLCGRLQKLPKRIAVFGFDRFTPIEEDLWAALRAAGAEVVVLLPEERSDCEHARVLACADAEEEIRTAALWARRKLEENPRARVGVIVPGLENLRDRIETVFVECLHPEGCILPFTKKARSFEISLGHPLSLQPVVRTAIRLLRLATSRLAAEELSSLLRSPYLAAGTSEAAGRATLDLQLKKDVRATVTLPQLLAPERETLRPLAPKLFGLLGELERKLPHQMTRSEWAVELLRLLTAAGWPGDGENGITLTSAEFQATGAWDALLSGFGALDQVSPERSPVELLRELEQAAAETMFAVENEGAPIQVVGPMAASGEYFDSLWMCGLTDDAWPQRGHPNPFIPYALQREAAIPHSSPEANVRDAEQITARLLQSADKCILSWPGREEDRELRASPVLSWLRPIAVEDLPTAVVAGWNDLQDDAELEEFVDEQAPALTDAEVRTHRTALLEWQSGCPFRAFAQARLAAEPTKEPTLGANPLDRGKVTELALQYAWERFREWQTLESITQAQFDHELASAIDRAVAEEFPKGNEEWLRRHRDIERERLNKLLREWLELERKRAPFFRVLHQQDVEVKIGELTVRGRIDRLEQTPGNAYIILDYKTGNAGYSPRWWDVPRPQDPQLPIYAVAQRLQGREVAGVAFARVKAGDCSFQGEATGKEIFGKRNNSKKYGLFSQTLDEWQPELERLAGNFLSGHAEVDPKDPPGGSKSSCNHCHLDALCRIAEFAAPSDDPEGGEVDDGE